MRVFIGGQVHVVPARWFFCEPGAQFFPSSHGAESSPWLLNFEVNDDWGEVTPWPQDPTYPTWRVLDRGWNPGYAGQCFLGDRQWFTDGQLPANILSIVPPVTFPDCCFPTPLSTVGGLVLGGTAFPSGPHGPTVQTAGGIGLGGTGLPTGEGTLATTAGGLDLGGGAVAEPEYVTAGGLVLGGTAQGSGGGGDSCTDAIRIQLAQQTTPRPFATGRTWFKIDLVAGQVYHAYLTTPAAPPVPAYWVLNTGSCDNLNIVDQDGYTCSQFTAPVTGTYYLFVFAQAAMAGTWTFFIDNGPC